MSAPRIPQAIRNDARDALYDSMRLMLQLGDEKSFLQARQIAVEAARVLLEDVQAELQERRADGLKDFVNETMNKFGELGKDNFDKSDDVP